VNVPAISVCVPTFNAERWIEATIESVLAQTRTDFELLVHDDASTDKTLAIVQRYQDPRIRLFTHETNKGAAATWNQLLQEATGRYVKLLCCDDLLYPSCLEQQAAALDDPANEAIAMTCSPRDIIDEHGRVLFRRCGLTTPGRASGHGLIRRIVASGRNVIGEPLTALFRRDLAIAVGGFNAADPYCIDLDLWCRLLAAGDLVVVPEIAGAFRVSSSAWSARLARQQAAQGRAFLARIREQLAPAMPSWMMKLGQARCTINAMLRQLLYLWLQANRCRTTTAGDCHR
jgi:glycosyltransferase involved in cell wall biosynthesis